MIREEGNKRWSVGGFRTRYRPKRRAGKGLIDAAPWIDIVLLLCFFFLLNFPFVLQPGINVELPRGEFRSGAPYGQPVFILSQKSVGAGGSVEVVFFDDNRFLLSDAKQVDQLKKAFVAVAQSDPEICLVVGADRRVKHGTVAKVLNIMTEAGIGKMNLATQQPRGQEQEVE